MFLSEWNTYLSKPGKKAELLFTLTGLVLIMVILAHFLNYIESRGGVVLNDPVLKMFKPVNLTWLIFFILYAALIISLLYLAKNPEKLIFAIKAYCIMIIIRIMAMYILPLLPPENMILLKDPVVEIFGTGQTLTKDLFFSGHTATLFLLFLLSDNKILKASMFSGTIVIGASLMLQHVHYSIDVFCAPVFAYSAYTLAIKIKKPSKKSL